MKKEFRIIADLIEKNSRVLDVGCGDGELMSFILNNISNDIRGIEISKSNVQKCISKGLTVIEGDAEKDLFQFPDSSFDFVITELSQKFAFVYQFHHLLPDLSALENVALPVMLAGLKKEEAFEISASLLEQVNLNHKEKNRPNELSGGERQRVAIARAMSNNPSCLIMDEPTGNLDTKNVENFMDLLLEMVSSREIALIIATHDNNVSSRLDRLLSLE